MVIFKNFSKKFLVFVAAVSGWSAALIGSQRFTTTAQIVQLGRQIDELTPNNLWSHVGLRGSVGAALGAGSVAMFMIHKDYYSPSEIARTAGIAGLAGLAAGAVFGWYDYSKIKSLYALNQKVVKATVDAIRGNQEQIASSLDKLSMQIVSTQQKVEQQSVVLQQLREEHSAASQQQQAATGRIEAEQQHQTQMLAAQAPVIAELGRLLQLPLMINGHSGQSSTLRVLPAGAPQGLAIVPPRGVVTRFSHQQRF